MIQLTWKQLRERFKDGEVFLTENSDGLNCVMFISSTEIYWDGPRHQDTANIVDWNHKMNLIDWFEEPSYVIEYTYTDVCSTNSPCSCTKCLEYDKLYKR